VFQVQHLARSLTSNAILHVWVAKTAFVDFDGDGPGIGSFLSICSHRYCTRIQLIVQPQSDTPVCIFKRLRGTVNSPDLAVPLRNRTVDGIPWRVCN
jgi:hypothetical protein